MITRDCVEQTLTEIISGKELTRSSADDLFKLLYIREHIGEWMSETDKFDKEVAEEWVSKMKNSDGSYGAHWSKTETDSVLASKGWNMIDKCVFWAVMNSIYSDYGATLARFGITDPMVFAELAKDWICDEDAVSDKALHYYKHIVKH